MLSKEQIDRRVGAIRALKLKHHEDGVDIGNKEYNLLVSCGWSVTNASRGFAYTKDNATTSDVDEAIRWASNPASFERAKKDLEVPSGPISE